MTEFQLGDKVHVHMPRGYNKREVLTIHPMYITSPEARFDGAKGIVTAINPLGPHSVAQFLVDFRGVDNGRLAIPWQVQWFREEWLELDESAAPAAREREVTASASPFPGSAGAAPVAALAPTPVSNPPVAATPPVAPAAAGETPPAPSGREGAHAAVDLDPPTPVDPPVRGAGMLDPSVVDRFERQMGLAPVDEPARPHVELGDPALELFTEDVPGLTSDPVAVDPPAATPTGPPLDLDAVATPLESLSFVEIDEAADVATSDLVDAVPPASISPPPPADPADDPASEVPSDLPRESLTPATAELVAGLHRPGADMVDAFVDEVLDHPETGDDATASSSGSSATAIEPDAPELPDGAVAGDGTRFCPENFPIKGNARSMIYHRPTDDSYSPTIPEVCFATESAAQAAGFRSRSAATHAPHNRDRRRRR